LARRGAWPFLFPAFFLAMVLASKSIAFAPGGGIRECLPGRRLRAGAGI
jgi:hypothetical protein